MFFLLIIIIFEKQNFNVLLKEEFNIFKNNKRLQKIANILVRIYLSSKNKANENILILDIISKFANSNNSNCNYFKENKENQIGKNSKNENFEEIKNAIQPYIYQGIFFIKVTDKPFIAAKKLLSFTTKK